MSKSIATILTVISFNLLETASGNAFLRIKKNGHHGQVNSDNLERTLLEEIEGQVGNANIRGRLARLEATLHPMFLSLPKNGHGNLDHSTVRYALHRLFVQRHGWYIKGLDNAGQSWNETSHANILKDQAADFVQSVFEHRLGDKGLNLHELAVLGATLEHLIHDESVERLQKAYASTRYETTMALSMAQATEITHAYMQLFILGEEIGATISDTEMNEIYPGWADTKQFAEEILRNTAVDQSSLDFQIVTKAVEEIAEQYGRFQDGECRVMKTDLIKLGDRNIGRVPLSDFYAPALAGDNFQFMESVDYLRSLGALDETIDPQLPSVIVPNYIGSQSNCVVSSSYYSVCCIDECEGLTSQLEKEFQSPEADPKEVLAVVAGLSSSTVSGPRELSAPLIRRLEDIAEGHHGTVPLHGRLFSQWMHHAFPRECQFPHVSGTTNPSAAAEWIEQEDMQKITDDSVGVTMEAVELTHWTHEEELLVPRSSPRSGSSLWASLRNVMFLSAVVAGGVQVASSSGTAAKAATTLYAGYDGKAGKLV